MQDKNVSKHGDETEDRIEHTDNYICEHNDVSVRTTEKRI